MIKILICCGGGFSSSALCKSMKNQIVENNLQDEFSIDFLPIDIGMKRLNEFNILICCPHLFFNTAKILEAAKEINADIPIYFLPPKMYGAVKFTELAVDIKDIIEIYNKTKTNPAHFPGEEILMTIPRSIAYRHYKK